MIMKVTRVVLTGVMFFVSYFSAAATSIVEIQVTVFAPPPCVINGNRTIDVDFGSNVLTNKVDGTNYLKAVDYSLDCQSDTSNAMKLLIQGNQSSFDTSALQTNISDFGVALRANGQPLVINNWINFTYPDKPMLQAVPVKKSGAALAGGEFSSGATLLVAYQ